MIYVCPAREAATVMTDRYYTTNEVAQRYRTVPGTVRWWRHIGYGPKGVRVGRRVLYPESEIRRFDEKVRRMAKEPT